MTILVSGWSRVDFFLRNKYKINILYIYIYIYIYSQAMTSYQMTNDSNIDTETFIWTKIEKVLDIVNTAKTGPRAESLTWSRISIEF